MTLDPYNAFLHRVGRRRRLADRGQGRDRRRGHADDGGVEDPPPRARARRRVRRAAPRGRCRGGREAEHPRVRVRRAHEQPALRPGTQPLGSRADDRRFERRQRSGRRRRARRRRARHRHGRVDPDPGRLLRGHRPPADRGARSDRWRRPGRMDPRRGRAAGANRRGVSAGAGDHGRSPARAGGRGPPGRHRHQAVRARPTPTSPRLRGSCPIAAAGRTSRSSCRCSTRSRRSPSSSCSRRRPPPTCGWLRTRLADYGADVRARLLAGLLLPSTAYLTRPPRPELGTVAVGARARRLRPARRAGDADRRAAPGRDPAGLPAADHAVQLAGGASRAPGHGRALRLRRRPPCRPLADGPPRRGRPHPRRRARVPAGDRLARAQAG